MHRYAGQRAIISSGVELQGVSEDAWHFGYLACPSTPCSGRFPFQGPVELQRS